MSRQSGSSTLEPGAVRTYHGRTIEDLIPRIQEELGPDAIIVHRREGLTGGVAGFFQRPYVEIDAIPGGPRLDVYDEEAALPSPVPQRVPQAPALAAPPMPEPAPHTPTSVPRTPFYEREPPHASQTPRYVTGHLAALAQSSAAPAKVERVDPFERVLERAASQQGSNAVERGVGSPPGVDPARARLRARASLQSRLVELGTSPAFAQETIDAAMAHVLAVAPRTPLAKAAAQALAQRIPVAPALPAHGAAIVVVGAGGAGKTSCCAALLAAYRANSTLRASCATLVRGQGKDEWRLLLSPQLRKPVAAAGESARRALRKAKDEGLLVIDTPPISPGERGGIRALGALLGELEPERVTIAVPATLGAVAAAQLLEALRPLGANAMALTHADETNQLGVALEAACKFGLAPEYALDRGRAGGWKLRRVDPTGLAATLLP